MKTNLKMTTSLVLLSAFTMTVLAPVASIASTVGRRNTAIGLTAAAIYAASKGKGTAALVAGAGAAYAWKRHADSKKPTYYYRTYRRGGHTYYYSRPAYGAGPSYNRGLHRGHAYGHYKKVYYRKDGRLHYYTVRR